MEKVFIALASIFKIVGFNQEEADQLMPMFVGGVINKIAEGENEVSKSLSEKLNEAGSSEDMLLKLKEIANDPKSNEVIEKASKDYLKEYVETISKTLETEQKAQIDSLMNNL